MKDKTACNEIMIDRQCILFQLLFWAYGALLVTPNAALFDLFDHKIHNSSWGKLCGYEEGEKGKTFMSHDMINGCLILPSKDGRQADEKSFWAISAGHIMKP